MTLLNSSTITTSPNNTSVLTTPKAPNNNGSTFSSSFLSTPNRSQTKGLSSLYPNISDLPRDLSKPHRIALSPIKSPPNSKLYTSNSSFNSSIDAPSSPSMTATLSQTKSAKKQIEQEYNLLLNRIKYLEEEERRSRAKLHQYDYITQKQEETKRLKQNTNNLFLKKKELQLRDIEGKSQIVSSIKDGHLYAKEKIKSFEESKKLENLEFKKKLELFKDIHKDQQKKLVKYNAIRRNEIKQLSEKMKEENRIKREEIAKQKQIERQQARNKNESMYHERLKQIQSEKEKQVQMIKSQRISLDEVQQYRISQSHDVVMQYAVREIEKEHETALQLEKSIEHLKKREAEAKRRLDEVERKLQSSPASPSNGHRDGKINNFSLLLDRSPRSKRARAFARSPSGR